jgi:hypothetical protein
LLLVSPLQPALAIVPIFVLLRNVGEATSVPKMIDTAAHHFILTRTLANWISALSAETWIKTVACDALSIASCRAADPMCRTV